MMHLRMGEKEHEELNRCKRTVMWEAVEASKKYTLSLSLSPSKGSLNDDKPLWLASRSDFLSSLLSSPLSIAAVLTSPLVISHPFSLAPGLTHFFFIFHLSLSSISRVLTYWLTLSHSLEAFCWRDAISQWLILSRPIIGETSSWVHRAVVNFHPTYSSGHMSPISSAKIHRVFFHLMPNTFVLTLHSDFFHKIDFAARELNFKLEERQKWRTLCKESLRILRKLENRPLEGIFSVP